MHAELATLRALLKELEWSKVMRDHYGDPTWCCPICNEESDLHDAECRLMAALATEPKP